MRPLCSPSGLLYRRSLAALVGVAALLTLHAAAAARQRPLAPNDDRRVPAWEDSRAADTLARTREAVARTRAEAAGPWAIAGDEWVSVGPFGYRRADTGAFVNGPLIGAATHPTDPRIIVVFPADGGFARTTDGGLSWKQHDTPKPLSDWWLSGDVGNVYEFGDAVPQPWAYDAKDPSIVYSAYNSPGQPGQVIRSADGGESWETVWTVPPPAAAIRTMAVDPRPTSGPTRLYVTTSSLALEITTSSLVFEIWSDGRSNRLPVASSATVVVAPGQPDFVYAHGSYSQTPLYESRDGGLSWVQARKSQPYERTISVAVGPGVPPVLYALEDSEYSWKLHRRGPDGKWSETGQPVPSCGRPSHVMVDPTNADIAYLAGNGLCKTTDAGQTWTQIPGIVEPRRAAFGPGGQMLVAGMTGLVSITPGAWRDVNRGFSAMRMTGVRLDPNRADTVYGVADRDHVVALRGAAGWTDLGPTGVNWTSAIRGGSQLALDADRDILFTVEPLPFGVGAFYSTRPVAWLLDAPRPQEGLRRVSWVLPDEPHIYSRGRLPPPVAQGGPAADLLFATTRVFRSTDGGATWQAMSSRLQDTCRAYPNGCASSRAALTALAAAPTAPAAVYAGGLYGAISATSDGATWKEATAGLPLRSVTALAVHPRDARIAWAGYGGYVTDTVGERRSGAGHVFRTGDGGRTWTDVTGNLPDVPVHTFALDGDANPVTVYVGTEVGVFRLIDGETTWQLFGRGLPVVPVWDLSHDAKTDRLAAATYGRGIFLISSRYSR